jgi:hypothetical protein
MNKFIDYFLNSLQTEKDAAKSTIRKYQTFISFDMHFLSIFS